ncbi:hypothetical protein AYO27_04675 [Rhizobium sp. GHKF11]|nr:hypothetical protein AYO27_04675 [Rhizobium sp. GHKF11]
MSIREKRVHAYNRQNGRCFYCQWPMWERAFEPQDHAMTRINAERSHKADPVANLQSFECTAEHLERRADGGSDAKTNIVAACLDCNSARNRVASSDWQASRIAANQSDQAGQDKGFDPVFYATERLGLREQYRFKWHHNFFVELPQWQVEVEAMKLGDFNRIGSRYQTASSMSLTYPLFTGEADFDRPDAIYKACNEIPGAQIMLESPAHEAALRAAFGNAVVKHK